MTFWNNNEVLTPSTNEQIHLKSIEDLKAQGIDTSDLKLEWKAIDRKTSAREIQELKSELKDTQNRGEIVERFLSLEQQVASRETVMDVKRLKATVGVEENSEKEEEQVETQLLAQAEGILEGNAGTKIKEKINKKVEESAESLLNVSRDKITSENWLAGLIGWPIFDTLVETDKEKGPWDSIIKTILTSILWFLGVGKVYESYKDSVWKIWDTVIKENDENLWDIPNDKTPELSKSTEEIKEKIQKKQDIYSAIWSMIFIQVSGERFPRNSDRPIFLEKIQNLAWGDVIRAYAEYLEVSETASDHKKVEIAYKKLIAILGIDEITPLQRGVLLDTLNSIAGPIPITLIQERITPENIAQITKDKNLEKKFWKEFIQNIQGKTPKELNFKQISIIYTLLFPGIISEKFEAWKNSIREFLFAEDAGNEFNAIVKDFKEKRNTLLSEETIQKILISGSPISYVSNDIAFKEFLIETWEEQEITKLIEFKNKFLDNLFTSQKYQLWGFDKFESKIRESTNYKDIISIYTFLNGNPDISQLDSLDSTGLYFWITKILDEDKEYAFQLIGETLVENSPHFTDVERSIIQKNFVRLGKTYLDIYFEAMEAASDAYRVLIKKSIENNLDIKVTDEVLDTSEWITIATILWVGWGTLFAPHPAVKILWIGVIALGGNYAALKLWDNNTFEKLETHMVQDNVYSLLDKILKEQFDGKGISDFAKARQSGTDFETFIWS